MSLSSCGWHLLVIFFHTVWDLPGSWNDEFFFFFWNLNISGIMRLWILFKPSVLTRLVWHHSSREKWGVSCLIMPSSLLSLHWHLREIMLIVTVGEFGVSIPTITPLIALWLGGIEVPCYCSTYVSHLHHRLVCPCSTSWWCCRSWVECPLSILLH